MESPPPTNTEETDNQQPQPPHSIINLSYPPLFRQAPPHTTNPIIPHAPNPVDIPLFDLRRLNSDELVQACKDWGLFRIENHGVPVGLLAELHEQAKRVFALPFDCKVARLLHPLTYFWGTPAIELKVTNVNWHEGVHVFLNQLPPPLDSVGEDDYEFSTFRSLVVEYGKHMAHIARTIFDVLATKLNLDNIQIASYLSEFDGIFRAYRYPNCPSSSFFGLETHTDSSVVTILQQDEVGGLQILRDDTWLDVAPISNTLIVNLGDMMQAISSDEYRSVQHRVLANCSKERISLCYFVFPDEESLITSSTYRPFTYKEFKNQVQKDIKATGYKVGLQRFKI